jgi:hypothetical protein
MSWSLNAAGHVPATTTVPATDTEPATSTPVDSVAVEVELYEALRAILTDPKYGAASSAFGGSHVSGSLHTADS